MQHKIERLVSGQARKLAAPDHPLHFLLYSSNKHLQEDSKYVDLQVGKQVWLNVPRRMRQELWLSVLHKNRGAGAAAAKEYAFRVRQALPEDVDADIEKDVGRTFPNAARFASEAGRTSLLRVLRAYAVYDTEVGYCQGMNFLAGLLLTWMPNEATAFAGLVVLMQQQGLRDLYKSDLARLQVHLWQFGRLLPSKLGRHMEGHGVLPVLYLSSWLLTSFASDFPLFFSSRVLDVVLTGSYPHAVLKVAMTLLNHCSKTLLALDDMEEIVHFLKAQVPNWSRDDLQDILSDALSQAWTPAQEAILNSETGVESVMDAVVRVSAQDRAAQLPQAGTQQTEQVGLNGPTAAAEVVTSLPPRTPSRAVSATAAQLSPAQQQAGLQSGGATASPLLSTRSVSWTERMRALRSSPSLTAAGSTTSHVDHARRHTTGEAAHPSSAGSWQQTSLQHCSAADQAATEPTIEPPSSLSSTPEPSSSSPNAQRQRSLPGDSPSQGHQPMASQSDLGGKSNAEADLLSFAAGASWQHRCEGIAGQQVQANGWSNSDDSRNNGLTEALTSTAQADASTSLQDGPSGSGGNSSSVGQSLVPPCLLLAGEFLADDPFQHLAALSTDVSHSSRGLSGLSVLADSQGSDLDSWGSFRLPDESSHTMAGDTAERQAGTVQSSHPVVARNQYNRESSRVSPTSMPVLDSVNVESADCEVSPNACITSKQKLQLDLFLQSSGGPRPTA